jgi:hypothetical protein
MGLMATVNGGSPVRTENARNRAPGAGGRLYAASAETPVGPDYSRFSESER